MKKILLTTSDFQTVPVADTTRAAIMIMIMILIIALIYRVFMLHQALC